MLCKLKAKTRQPGLPGNRALVDMAADKPEGAQGKQSLLSYRLITVVRLKPV